MIIFITFGIIAMVIFLQRIIYVKFAFFNLSFSYSFSRSEVEEGDIFYITETIENKKYLPLPAVSTLLEVGAGLAFADLEQRPIEQKSVFCFYTVGIYKKITRTWRVKAVMRGYFDMSGITVNVRDIFGLVKISKDFLCQAGVLILPSPYDINQRLNSPLLTGGDFAVPAGYFFDPFEIQKISPYTYSEPQNKINWKASAKAQSLLVNQEHPAIFERISIILDASEKHYIEKNIKLCATLKKILPEHSEVLFFSNGHLPKNRFCPLVRFTEQNGTEYIETHEFNLSDHDKNFRRLLAEILGGELDFEPISAHELAERAKKTFLGGRVIMAKGGKLYELETGQAIYA